MMAISRRTAFSMAGFAAKCALLMILIATCSPVCLWTPNLTLPKKQYYLSISQFLFLVYMYVYMYVCVCRIEGVYNIYINKYLYCAVYYIYVRGYCANVCVCLCVPDAPFPSVFPTM